MLLGAPLPLPSRAAAALACVTALATATARATRSSEQPTAARVGVHRLGYTAVNIIAVKQTGIRSTKMLRRKPKLFCYHSNTSYI